MTDLFDHAEAQAAKIAGMGQAEANAKPGWSEYMLRQVELTATELPRFTSDDVFDRVDADPAAPTTHDNRAFGSVMKNAARKNFCIKADCAPLPSRRKELHASPRSVWVSLLWRK